MMFSEMKDNAYIPEDWQSPTGIALVSVTLCHDIYIYIYIYILNTSEGEPLLRTPWRFESIIFDKLVWSDWWMWLSIWTINIVLVRNVTHLNKKIRSTYKILLYSWHIGILVRYAHEYIFFVNGAGFTFMFSTNRSFCLPRLHHFLCHINVHGRRDVRFPIKNRTHGICCRCTQIYRFEKCESLWMIQYHCNVTENSVCQQKLQLCCLNVCIYVPRQSIQCCVSICLTHTHFHFSLYV